MNHKELAEKLIALAESLVNEQATWTLVASYVDGVLMYAAIVEEETGNPYLPRFWPWYYGDENELNWELVELVNVPADIARKLVVQGSREQVYSDGYEATQAAIPYVGKIVYVWEPEELF